MALLAVCLVALVFGFVGSLPLAGPIAILVVSNGVKGQYAKARRIGYGAAVAEALYAFLAFWGFATFLARHPGVLPVSHGVTGVLLVALGVHFLRFKEKAEDGAKVETKAKSNGPFFVGLSISALNPTLLATWSAVTTFLYSRQLVHMQGILAVPFGVCAGLGVALWAVLFVWVLKRFKDHFPQGALRWVVRSMGVVLLGIGVWSLVELARYVIDPAKHRAAEASEVSLVQGDEAAHGARGAR